MATPPAPDAPASATATAPKPPCLPSKTATTAKPTAKKTPRPKTSGKKPAAGKGAAKVVRAKKVTAAKPAPKSAAKPTAQKKSRPKKQAIPKPAPNPAKNSSRVPLADPGPAEVLGRIVWLMLQSEAHKHLFLTDLEWRVLPPVLLKQFRLFRKDGAPIGYAAWAYLDDGTDARIRAGDLKLQPEHWRSGPNLWLLDLIAPFGGDEVMIKELSEKVFKGKKFRTLISGENEQKCRLLNKG